MVYLYTQPSSAPLSIGSGKANASGSLGLGIAAIIRSKSCQRPDCHGLSRFFAVLGAGVAFKIYYVMAWRTGKTMLVQSSLTRAVIFSAMTTAIAFGSLWLSPNPGMSSMGKLMALALVSTMAAAVLFQPA